MAWLRRRIRSRRAEAGAMKIVNVSRYLSGNFEEGDSVRVAALVFAHEILSAAMAHCVREWV